MGGSPAERKRSSVKVRQKKRLSELMSRAAYIDERCLLEWRGKPMAAVVSVEDLARLEKAAGAPKGPIEAVGALADFDDEVDRMKEDSYRVREQAQRQPIENWN